jgi:hypothetical protein
LRQHQKKEMQIPQPHFILRNKKDTKPTVIQCHLRFENERIVFSTGEKIKPIEWDFSKQRAINSKKYPHNTELNIWLDKVDAEIKSLFRAFNIEDITPTPDLIRMKIKEKVFNKIDTKTPSLLDFIDSYITECSKLKNPNTVRTYITTFKHLKSYANTHSISIDYSHINLNFYNSFLNYLTHDLTLSKNTIGKHIQVFKTFMNEATDRGYVSLRRTTSCLI